MDNLINKVTLYDIISMIIPGFITFLAVCSFIPKEISEFISDVNNSWFIFGIVLTISYCIGWILSESMNYIYDKKLKKILIRLCTKNFYLLVFNMVIIICILIGFIINKITLLKLLFIVITFFDAFYVYSNGITEKNDEVTKRSNSKIIDNEYLILAKKCYGYLKDIYSGFASIDDLNDEEIIKKVEVMSKSSYFLIQTDSKYNRIHNYNSSKSFSKNLSGVCLILSIVFSYHFFVSSSSLEFNIVCIIGIIFCLFGYFRMVKRYFNFKNKLNILIITYYLDLLENKKLNLNNDLGRK